MNILKKIGLLILLVTLFLSCKADTNAYLTRKVLIPLPSIIEGTEGKFVFNDETVWCIEDEGQRAIVNLLLEHFRQVKGYNQTIVVGQIDKEDNLVEFLTDKKMRQEAYRLTINSNRILVEASDNKGFFYATQTLRQLLPPSFESEKSVNGVEWSVAATNIIDEPRFEYRGLLLDVARFFIPKERVMKIMDCAAMLKINKLHLHLVDGQGWRIEIKKYPKLTEIGAWNVKRDEIFSSRKNAKEGETTPMGGFYTQQDIKDMVAYAADRQIEIIPEIEMPAHTNSSLAAYPELACPTVNRFIGVIPGMGGYDSEIVYCAGNEQVFIFLKDVMDEVMSLFPSYYVHLGGDEASKTNWGKCPKCQARMKEQHLTNLEDLQGYFMNRVAKYVQSKGRQVIGWDEWTNSTMPNGAVILGWQGNGEAGCKAAQLGHQFVMTPSNTLYLDYYQGPQWYEPRAYFGNNTLLNIYNYEPIQKEWSPEVISKLIGVQCGLWTEFMTSVDHVEYMLLPRLAALSEIAWCKASQKNWGDFVTRLDMFNERLDYMGMKYSQSMYNLDHRVMGKEGKLAIVLSCIRPDVEIRYTLDGSEPSASSLFYQDTLFVNKAIMVRAATFMNKKQKGKVLNLKLGWNKATGKKVTGNDSGNRAYVLTNGLRGSDKYTDFEWAGWYNEDASFEIDLGRIQPIRKVILGCITNYGMGSHIPSVIEVYVSDDNKEFTLIATRKHSSQGIFKEGIYKTDEIFDNLSVNGRYLKLKMKNSGICPEDHTRPGKGTWMNFDEVIVQ